LRPAKLPLPARDRLPELPAGPPVIS